MATVKRARKTRDSAATGDDATTTTATTTAEVAALALRQAVAAEAAVDAEVRTRVCQEWLASACTVIRKRLQLSTQVRQALAAGLTDEEAHLSVESAQVDLDKLVAATRAVEARALEVGFPLPIEVLALQAGLDELDRDILLLAVAPHVDVELRDAIARFNDNLLANYIDVRMCLEFLIDDPVERLAIRKRFAPDGPLRVGQLVQLERPRDIGGDNLLAHEVLPAGRVMQLLLGETGLLDSAMSDMAVFERPEITLADVILPPDDLAPLLGLLEQHAEAPLVPGDGRTTPFDVARGLVVEISGPPGTGKSLLVRALANHLGRPLLELDAGRLNDLGDESLRRTLYSALDQARLAGAVLVLDGVDGLLGKGSTRVGEIQDSLRRHPGICILVARESASLDGNLDRFVVQRLLVEMPDAHAREQIFHLHLPAEVRFSDDALVTELAGVYTFPGALIRNAMQVAVNRARADSSSEPVISRELLRKACHEQIRASLDEYAVRRRATLTLRDLILPDEAKADIDELFDAAKYRSHVLHNWGFDAKMSTGKGVVSLFSGDPGTGKTLCATILANELDQQLYQISIPRVVSKWIGETEKNIEQIFRTAKANHGILLFDEADSLFASRTKVESSVDRYSNMATNMLLQEIENFDGIVILTTNLERNIDKAFQRRIGFKINFPFPEAEMRAAIWETLVPSSCPIDPEIDWDLMGEAYELSGGHIKNAVLRAAYRAAADGKRLNMTHLEFAARQECKNAGRVFRAVGHYDLI